MLVEEPFCGPHTTVKSSPASHWKSEGACSPSTTNTTLKRSSCSTMLCTSTRMLGCAHAASTANRAVAIAKSRFILPILFLLAGLQGLGLFLIDLFLGLFFLVLDGLEQLLGLLRAQLLLLVLLALLLLLLVLVLILILVLLVVILILVFRPAGRP